MTPIIEGLDGVQKMSKSLNNAIGIHEPPQEMYGKLMSINDEMMWRYWTLLTDLRQSRNRPACRPTSLPARCTRWKPRSASRAPSSPASSAQEAAQAADENWARQFQQKSDDVEGLEEVRIAFAELTNSASAPGLHIRVPKLLVRTGLAASGAEASRKLAENAVRLDGETVSTPGLAINSLPTRITVRVGKRAKIAVIE